MGDKAKEPLFKELLDVGKMLEEKTEINDQMIRKFQLLIAHKGLFSQIIDFFPYPIAIFTPACTVTMVNKAFAAESKIPHMNLEDGTVRILQHKIKDIQLAAAFKQVFSGGTSFFEELNKPFSIFSGITCESEPRSERFRKAVIFPVPADDDKITHGVIVFMP